MSDPGVGMDGSIPYGTRAVGGSVSDAHGLGSYTWYVIALLSTVNVFSYMDRMALAVLAPGIKADLDLSDGQLGLLTGLAFSLFYALCGLPIAQWADRGIRRNIIALAITVWSVMTALSGAAQSFWHLFLARIGIGAGEAGCLPPAQSMICDYVPLEQRAGVFAVHAFGNYAGIMIGMALAGWLGEAIGWRWTFLVLGIPGIALALIVRFTLREPARGAFDTVKYVPSGLSLRETLRVLWRVRTYRLLLYYLVVNGFVLYGLNQWWPSFYVRLHGLSPSDVGVYLGLAMGGGFGLGLLSGGVLANKAAQRDIGAPLTLGAVSTVFAVPSVLASLFVPSPVVSILLVAVTTVFWGVSNGPVVASMYSVTAPQLRATAGATAIFCTSVLGFGLGPLFVGVLSDLLAPSLRAESLRYALVAPICLFPVMVFVLHAAARALPNDLGAARARAAALS